MDRLAAAGVDPLHPAANVADNLIVHGAALVGDIVHRIRGPTAKDHRHIPLMHVGDAGHIHNDLVHAHAPHHRGGPPVHRNDPLVGQCALVAVRIAHRKGGYLHVLRRGINAAVAQVVAFFNWFHQAHYRFQF
ncbi:hypothetical protein SDC9_119459 [bioreactor metagenome]|uniref:Uncharacterized protein n=1 Tax=bioreactor metagenome TaxID=1076179 RepID=A0A645C8Q4_9ZZZZ